jgi:hypothetical protein
MIFPPDLHHSTETVPAGWCSRSLPECVARLTALFAFQRELMRTEAAWLAGVPYWDAKLAIADHVLADARIAEAFLKRLHELKASSAEHKQIAGLEELVRALAGARNGDEWLRGLYLQVKPWLAARLADYLGLGDPVMDAPSREIVRSAIAEVEAQVAWFRAFRPAFSSWEQKATSEWESYVSAVLAATDVLGPGNRAEVSVPERPTGAGDFEGVAEVRRDTTFRVVDKSPYPREGATFAEKRFLVFYNHTQEMQFAESLGAILYETAEMPWAFHHDLARHMADEVRHARMGQTRLAQLGVALTEIPMLTQHYRFRSNMDPLERFCLMTLVMEATAFERKRANVELFEAQGDAVSTLYETYDIRDEMLHTNLGHVWVPILLRVYHDSRSVPELVEHCRGLIAQVITEYPANAANMLKK